MTLAAVAIAVLWHPVGGPAGGIDDFAAQVKAVSKSYEPVLAANAERLRDGKFAEATQALLDLVPERRRSAAHWFVLGNFLFQQDFALSYALHEKAFELAPDESLTRYEFALERHRKREYAEAEALWAKLATEPGESDPRVHALRADCLLRTGRLKEAIAAWKTANPRGRHTVIEQGFSWIYGAPHPLVERARLLGEIRGGNLAAVEELLLLDLVWQTDWWNAGPNEECLGPDLELAASSLGAGSPRYRQLALLVELTPKDGSCVTSGDPELVKRLREERVAGADVPLAENSRVAGWLLDLVARAGAATPAELLAWYEKPLRDRVEAKPGDPQALEILASFYEKDGRRDRLAAIEETGWRKFGAVACACGMLDRKGEALASGDPLLKAALAKHPADQHLRAFAVECAMREKKGELAAVVAYLEAHLERMVSWNDGAHRGFLALEQLAGK